jgi:hypothetical protein
MPSNLSTINIGDNESDSGCSVLGPLQSHQFESRSTLFSSLNFRFAVDFRNEGIQI